MGCSSSKPASRRASHKSVESATPSNKSNGKIVRSSTAILKKSSSGRHANDQVYAMLNAAMNRDDSLHDFWSEVQNILDTDPKAAAYTHPKSLRNPIHLACSMVDLDDGTTNDDTYAHQQRTVLASIQAMIRDAPETVAAIDAKGHIPLHYVINRRSVEHPNRLRVRAQVLRALVAANAQVAIDYFSYNATVFDFDTGGVTPLYHALQSLPDDCVADGPTVPYIAAIQEICPPIVGISNASDGDKPLALLYRRFTRQFDLSEKFFTGDNSRQEVVLHRRRFKIAAGNTWKLIELLLRPPGGADDWKVVHRAIQVETPPDLLRYIVETNAEDLTQPDEFGNLPIHYAAKSLPQESSFPAFYSKYIIDELLYKFPEAASFPDAEGLFPLTLAVQTGKQWIGGGVKSLYDAYPDALSQIDLDSHASLRQALSFGDDKEKDNESPDSEPGEEMLTSNGVVRDEHHDAIMLVQQDDVAIFEIVSAMWAHEEDAGVQMLGCIAIGKWCDFARTETDRLRIALSTIAAVVNAMKAHPNEPVVQEKASSVLKKLACADGKREVSFVAAGAVAAVAGGMQAHVGDATVQEETCAAIAEIVRCGGSELATVVASVSGITAILNALGTHPESAGVQLEACRALKYVTDYPHANVPDLPRASLEPLLEAAKQICPACTENANILMSRLS